MIEFYNLKIPILDIIAWYGYNIYFNRHILIEPNLKISQYSKIITSYHYF